MAGWIQHSYFRSCFLSLVFDYPEQGTLLSSYPLATDLSSFFVIYLRICWKGSFSFLSQSVHEYPLLTCLQGNVESDWLHSLLRVYMMLHEYCKWAWIVFNFFQFFTWFYMFGLKMVSFELTISKNNDQALK